MQKITTVFRLSLHLMWRHKVAPLALFAVIAVLLCTALAAEFGGRQPATVALDVGLSTIRLLLPLFLVFQAQELFSKEFDRKFYHLSLAYPITRPTWFAGRFLALFSVTILLLLLAAALLSVQTSIIAQGYVQANPVSLGLPFWLTILFTALDLLVLLALASFLAVTASTPSFVLIGTLGFMLIARSYSTILALLAANASVVHDAEAYRSNLGLLGYLLPDLGALDIRMISLYGQIDLLPHDWPLLVSSTLLYTFGFVALGIRLFQRKQFI